MNYKYQETSNYWGDKDAGVEQKDWNMNCKQLAKCWNHDKFVCETINCYTNNIWIVRKNNIHKAHSCHLLLYSVTRHFIHISCIVMMIHVTSVVWQSHTCILNHSSFTRMCDKWWQLSFCKSVTHTHIHNKALNDIYMNVFMYIYINYAPSQRCCLENIAISMID